MKTLKFLTFVIITCVFLFITYVVAWDACHSTPYGFFDDSIKGQIRHIVLDGKVGYRIHFRLPFQESITIEEGAYNDPGGNEITLIPGQGQIYQIRVSGNEVTLTPKKIRTYKISVWGRGTKNPQYRIKI